MILVNLYGRQHKTNRIAESWDELDPVQLSRIMGILASGVTKPVAGVKIAALLLELDAKDMREIDAATMVDEVLPLVEWAFTPPNQTKQLFLHKRGWYGPASDFANLRVTEFDSAEKELWHWREEKDDVYLYRFLAVLYRKVPFWKRKWNFLVPIDDEEGDRRPRFDATSLSRNAGRLKNVFNEREALAILAWYQACKKQLFESFPDLPTGEASEDRPEYFQVLRMISKEGTYGTFDQVEQLFIYNVLMELECAHKDAEAIRNHKSE